MKATGEVMGIGATLEECFLKSVRSLETGVCHFYLAKFDSYSTEELEEFVSEFHADNIYAICELLRRGVSVEKLYELTQITSLFLESFKKITDMEQVLKNNKNDLKTLKEAKVLGFSDKFISQIWGIDEIALYHTRKENGITPIFRMVDTLHTGKYIAYLYIGIRYNNIVYEEHYSSFNRSDLLHPSCFAGAHAWIRHHAEDFGDESGKVGLVSWHLVWRHFKSSGKGMDNALRRVIRDRRQKEDVHHYRQRSGNPCGGIGTPRGTCTEW
jgi:hypothetical protein